jgi:hypothetical protein
LKNMVLHISISRVPTTTLLIFWVVCQSRKGILSLNLMARRKVRE